MRVRLTTNVMLNSAHRAAGSVVELDDATAQRLIARRHASASLDAEPAQADPSARIAALEAENAELRAKLDAPKPPKSRAAKPVAE